VINRILIPVDGSELSDRVLISVRRLLRDLEDADVELLRVLQPACRPEEEWAEKSETAENELALRREAARHHLEQLQERLADDGIDACTRVAQGDPAEAILARIESFRASLVAMATHGRTGLNRWVRGSVAERVLRRCPVPLLLSNPVAAQGRAQGGVIRKILVPLDGSDRSARILPLAEAFAQHYGSQLHLIRVVPPDETSPEPGAQPTRVTSADALASLEVYAAVLRNTSLAVRCSTPLERSPAEAILVAAEADDVDLIAMTTHGYSGLDRWLFGSVAEKVMRHCTCPLLVQRENS
jgi:nucleotide-binding universal stress UspA family protein